MRGFDPCRVGWGANLECSEIFCSGGMCARGYHRPQMKAGAQRTHRYEVARLVLSRVTHPVAIVSATFAGERSCATGTTMYVSMAPAMVAIAQHPGSKTTGLARDSGEFSLSLLEASQHELAVAAGRSSPGGDKFAALGIATVDPPDGLLAPGVAGCLAVLWCRIVRTDATGDHLLFVAEVVAHQVDPNRVAPLLRFHRRYMSGGPFLTDESPEGYPL
jgi:flavin reductase (DIM6/NTAB) family NADH-FMN oxidoreductase RutF